ncbi:Deuterolysin metalloprotease family-domain-containing protein [Crucibulum laeve]|uniref:Neutral protease 2 n=1 Tax=Crucibulum laeve TaxID=68775 RepID=A0A5C3MEZ9_9AGAR|nr:Deuterolysin metalloprotease family-domain-containing protein [Crucibulum laeve]
MFIRSIVALGFAAAALATPYKRFNGLTVDVVGPAGSVSSIDDLKFTATVKNTGAETVKILKYGTILDEKLPTKSFIVTKDGAAVPFTGIKLSVSLSDVDDSAFAIIPAGESVTVSHQVASLFDFASVGNGKFAFEPITNFIVTGAQEKATSAAKLSKVQATSTTVVVEITSDLSKRELSQLNKRATDICTTASRKSFIDASYSEAKTLASTASSYVSSHGASDSLYRSYFGATATSRVTSILNAVANENSSSRTLSCTDTYGACSSGVIAYTVISTTNIYFCSIFFNEVATSSLCSGTTVASRNARGGTTLHELTHAVGGTDDIAYGCSTDQGLSDANKISNADNFNCFTTQVYQNTRC